MRYTCNKKAYPEFEKDCKNCSEYDPCAKGGKWCFVAVADLFKNEPMVARTAMPAKETLVAPVMVKHDYRKVKIDASTTITIDLEEIKERIARDFYRDLRLPGVMQCGR